MAPITAGVEPRSRTAEATARRSARSRHLAHRLNSLEDCALRADALVTGRPGCEVRLRAQLLREIKKKIAEFGLTAADLGLAPPVAPKRAVKPPAKSSSAKSGPFSKKRRATAGVKVAPKYRGPAGELWTGRGRQPTWVAEAIAAGRTMDDLLITRTSE